MSGRALPALGAIDRLLIVKSSSIGDVVHALPVVEAIKQAKPDLTIGWVVRKRCADVLTGNPVIDSFLQNERLQKILMRLADRLAEKLGDGLNWLVNRVFKK